MFMGYLYRPGFYPHKDIVGKIKAFFVQPLQHFYTSTCTYVMQAHTNTQRHTHTCFLYTNTAFS